MWIYPRIVAHRGGGTLAPENTLAAMRCGLQHGFRAVEFDVMLTKDGVPVLMHDYRFGRTVRGFGSVPETTAVELTAMDAGSWLSPAFAGEPVPTYEQVLAFCKDNAIWMNVEIKPAPLFEALTGRIVGETTRRLFASEIAAGKRSADLLLFSSFSFDALMTAKEAAPDIPRGFLVDKLPSDWLQRLHALDAVALHINQKNLSEPLAHAVKAEGFGLFCYTVNTPERARELFACGVDAIFTDHIYMIGPDFA